LFNIISTFLLRAISIFTAPVFSRLLGTGGYGVVTAFNTWTNITAAAGTSQTYCTLPNARTEYPEEEQEKYQSAIMGLSMTLLLCVSAVILLFLPWVAKLMKMSSGLVVLVLVQAFGMYCVSFLNYKFTYELKPGRNMLVTVAVALLTLGASLLLVILLPKEINYYGRIGGNALIYGIAGLAACFWILRKGKVFYHRAYWKFCLALSIPLALQSLSDLLLGNTDLIMLRHIWGDSASGIYGLALSFSGIIFSLFCALNNSWVPFFFEESRRKNHDQVAEQAKNFMELYTVLSVGFILVAPEVYRIFASSDYWDGIWVIPVFTTSYYLNFLCTFPVNFEYYHKKTKIVSAATILAALLNIGLNALVIPRYGIYGAACASCASHTVQFLLHYLYSRYILGKTEYPFPTSMWGKYALVYAAFLGTVYLTKGYPLLRWGLGVIVGFWELYMIRKRKVLI